jgi:tRNA-dihydrouridine synthase
MARMSCQSNNATDPTPAIAPGGEGIDPRRVAEELGALGGVDGRVRALVAGFDAPFFQAGLAGYSDAAMRIIARRHGCPFCVTEALLDRTLLAGGRGFAKADLGEIHDNIPGGREDQPLAGQIMGSDPREMSAAALKMIEQASRADAAYRELAYEGRGPGQDEDQHLRLPGGEQIGRVVGEGAGRIAERPVGLAFATIDVNLACPVKKIQAKARGGHWLAQPEGAIKILEAVRESVPAGTPCTVKLRRSFDDTPEMARAFERILSAAFSMGYAWATVHARTVEQKYVGPSRWDLLGEIVSRHPGRLIFGSGDVWTAPDIFRMIRYTGVAAVSVARGCIGNPWIFRQAREMMAGRAPSAPTIGEQRGVLREHYRLLLAVCSGMRHAEDAASKQIRKFGIRFAAHHPRAEEVRLRMIAVSSVRDWENVLEEHYRDDAGEGEGARGLTAAGARGQVSSAAGR